MDECVERLDTKLEFCILLYKGATNSCVLLYMGQPILVYCYIWNVALYASFHLLARLYASKKSMVLNVKSHWAVCQWAPAFICEKHICSSLYASKSQ